jgi:hypothetical protein
VDRCGVATVQLGRASRPSGGVIEYLFPSVVYYNGD